MPTPPLLDFDALTAPIPGASPAGKAVPFATREQLEASRKEVDLSSFSKNDPLRPVDPQRADWPKVAKLARETLAQSSKDLLTAARLTEAMTKVEGFAGLRDGLSLLRRLVEGCWDRLYPPIEEEDDVEVRAAAFFWLADPDRGARFPHALRALTIVGDDPSYSWREWKEATVPPKDDDDYDAKARIEAFEKTVQLAPRDAIQLVADDLRAAQEELDALDRALDVAMGRHAPGLTSLREAIGQCALLADQLLAKKGPAPASASVGEPVTSDDAPDSAPDAPAGTSVPRPSAPGTSRAQIYQQIADAATALKRLEPHSPIPYILERAVELGGLPFPELMRVLVRNPEVLEMMGRELGIKAIADGD